MSLFYNVRFLEPARAAFIGCNVVFSTDLTTTVTSVVVFGVVNAAISTKCILGVGAHVTSMSQSVALLAVVNLLAV